MTGPRPGSSTPTRRRSRTGSPGCWGRPWSASTCTGRGRSAAGRPSAATSTCSGWSPGPSAGGPSGSSRPASTTQPDLSGARRAGAQPGHGRGRGRPPEAAAVRGSTWPPARRPRRHLGSPAAADPDLLLQFAVCRRAGVAVAGPGPAEVFAEPPRAWLLERARPSCAGRPATASLPGAERLPGLALPGGRHPLLQGRAGRWPRLRLATSQAVPPGRRPWSTPPWPPSWATPRCPPPPPTWRGQPVRGRRPGAVRGGGSVRSRQEQHPPVDGGGPAGHLDLAHPDPGGRPAGAGHGLLALPGRGGRAGPVRPGIPGPRWTAATWPGWPPPGCSWPSTSPSGTPPWA